MVQTEAARRTWPRWLIYTGIGFVVLLAAAIVAGVLARPWLHARALEMLESRSEGQVKIQDFHIFFFPLPRITGSGIIIRHHGRTDVPPLIQIREFSATASFAGLLGAAAHSYRTSQRPDHSFSPKDERRGTMGSTTKDVPVLIDQLVADDAELDMLPANPQKPTHQFLIHQLNMRQVGRGHAAPFVAMLSNPAPPGEIHVRGDFGPWQPDDPRTTPVSATYTFEHADLSVFKGIAGNFDFPREICRPARSIAGRGNTTTPDFTVTSGGHPMMLKTEFSATVDGTNGDTLLHPVVAHLLGSILICNGSVIRSPQGKGREVVLEVTASNARIEDLLRLAVKTAQPPMTGRVNLKTKFDLPSPYEGGEVVDRLKLDGKFGIGEMQFTSPDGAGKGREPERPGARPAQGHPRRRSFIPTARRFSPAPSRSSPCRTWVSRWRAPRSHSMAPMACAAGLDFHGKVQLQAKPSQMVTGFKSALLRPFDHFLRKNGVTEMPIKVTGKRDHPNFGLDFHHKKDPGQQAAIEPGRNHGAGRIVPPQSTCSPSSTKPCSGGGQPVSGARPEHVESGPQNHADEKLHNQAADNDDGERPLRVGADVMRHGRRQQAERGHQHGHHDGPQTQPGAFPRGLADRQSAHPQLVDVLDHDDADLDRNSNQCQKPESRGHAEVGSGQQQAEESSERREADHGQNKPTHFHEPNAE